MKRKSKFILRILASTVSVVLLASAFPFPSSELTTADAAQTTTISNPIIWADVPDEDIIRVGDTYYMVSTTMYFSPGAPIMKSKDLVSWEICNYVYDTYADGDKQTLKNGENDYSHGQWAASLRYHDGNFYVFFGSYGTGKSYIYKTSDIENGTWTRSEINGMYHDASILFDDDGRNYLVYGAGGTAKIKEFNSDMTGFKKDGVEQTLFSTGLDNLAGEGWHIQKINGYYYIFVIAWPSNSKRIELCYRSKELLGTYEGKTILNSGLGTYGSGVAQGGIVDTPDGKWYAMLFQDSGAVGRIPILVPVTWKDHFPFFGQNGHVPEEIEVHSTRPGYIYQPLVGSDDFCNGLLPRWQFNHDPDPRYYHLDALQGTYTITTREVCTELTQAVNTLTQRMSYPSCAAEVTVDASALKEGDVAGLCALQGCYAAVGITKRHGKYEVLMLDKKEDGILDMTEGTVVESHQMDFRLEADFCNMKDEARCYYRVNKGDWLPIGTVHKLYFKLDHFTGCRFGLFCYAAEETGGSACFRDFKYYDVDEIS